MAFYDKFPYTNFQEINLDKLIIKMLQLELEQKEFINNNVIKYADPIGWNITTQYEANTVVTDVNGNAYISSQPVPAGVNITNTDYWSKIGNFDALYKDIKDAITTTDEGAGTTATAARAVNDLVWLQDKLVIVTSPMIPGDSYVIGSNCEYTDIDDELKKVFTGMNTLTQYVDDSVQDAKDYVDDKIQALPEFPTPEVFGAKGDGITNDTAAFQALLQHCIQNDVKCYIPNKDYILDENILFDHSLIVSNGGNFPVKKLFTNGTHIADFQVSLDRRIMTMDDLKGVSYPNMGLQACCENPKAGTILIGISEDTNAALVECDYQFNIIRRVAGQFGHINDMCYNKARETIFIAPGGAGANASTLIEVDPLTLGILNTYDLNYPGYAKWHVAYDEDSNTMVSSNYAIQWYIDAETMDVYHVTNIDYKAERNVPVIMQNSFFNDGKLYTCSFIDGYLYNWCWTSYNYVQENVEHEQTMQGFSNGIEYEGIYSLNNRKYILAADGTNLYQLNIFDKSKVKDIINDDINMAGVALSDENVDDLIGTGSYACRNATIAAQLSGNVPFNAQRGFLLTVQQTAWRAVIQKAYILDGTGWYRTYDPDTNIWSSWHLIYPMTFSRSGQTINPQEYADYTFSWSPLDYIPNVQATILADTVLPRYALVSPIITTITSSGCNVRIFNGATGEVSPALRVMVY